MTDKQNSNVDSPCVNWCQINPQNKYCFGCYRTIEEIAAWSDLNESEKQAVWEKLSQRKLLISSD
jgi:predicted Fe-S protein YdhL (DUF1289 family)